MNRVAAFLLGFGVVITAGCVRDVNVGAEEGTACTEIGKVTPAADGCNTCRCGTDGVLSCTNMNCSPTCTAGETKDAADGCNTCTCGENGDWSCTEKACSPTCTAGETKDAADGCNTCTCGENGDWSCTEKACSTGQCTPGTVGEQDACGNRCWCTDDGNWACYAVYCAKCIAGETKPDGAGNTCTCSAEGVWACPNTESPGEPKPGDMKAATDGYNTCVFTTEGTWNCTRMALTCTPAQADVPATDGLNTCACTEQGRWDCTQNAGGTCTAGAKRLVDGCNWGTCTESSTGRGWEQTDMYCDSCTVGTIKLAGDLCNTCACGANGTWSCTNEVCPSCKPGDVASDGTSWCTNCTCQANGTWSCSTSPSWC